MRSWYQNVGKFTLLTATEFHCTCARELLTGAVLLRALSKFAQNLSSTGNHSRSYAIMHNFWYKYKCVIYVCDIMAWKWVFFRSLLAYGHLLLRKKKFFFLKYVTQSRLLVGWLVGWLVCWFVCGKFTNHGSSHNFHPIFMKICRKLRFNVESRPLNFGRYCSKVKVMTR